MTESKAQKLKVGISGLGWGVKVQVPAFRYGGLDVVALTGRRQDALDAACKEHKVEGGFTDFGKFLESGIDLVSIVSPPMAHVEQV